MQVTIDDFYSSPFAGTFKIIVDDPLISKFTKEGKGLKDDIIAEGTGRQRLNIFKAAIKIKEATRDGRLILKVISDKYPEEIMLLKIYNEA